MKPKAQLSITYEDLREEIRRQLREDDFGDDFGDMALGGDMYGAYGADDPWPGSLMKTFVQPFVDVGKTAAGALQDVGSKAQEIAETAIEGVKNMFIPFIAAEYSKIHQAESDRAQKIKQKYADVLQRNDEAFKGDAQGFAFMIAPSWYLTQTIARSSAVPLTKNAADALLRLIDMISGRANSVTAVTNKARQMIGESLIREDGNDPKADDDTRDKNAKIIRAVMNNPKVKAALKDSPMLKSMEHDTRAMVGGMLEKLMGLAKKIMAAKSVKELNQLMGKNMYPKGFNDLDANQKQEIENLILTQVKKGTKNLFDVQMKRDAKWLLDQGIDPNNPYMRAWKKSIAMVDSLRP